MTLNGFDMLIIFTWGLIVTFFLSLVCDLLIGKFVFKGMPPSPEQADDQRAAQ